MVVGKDYSALRASPYGSLPAATLSRWRSGRTLVEVSHPSPHGQNIQLWICWGFQELLKVMVVGEGLLSAARFALRVVACGNALSLALGANLGRSFSSFPAWAEYSIVDLLGISGTFESDGGGGRITQRCALRPTGRCLRQRSLAGARVEP